MSKLEFPGLLIDAHWLYEHLEHESLIVFDASWHMPAAGRDGVAEWAQQHIPGARHFDFDGKVCEPNSELPHMMPSASLFTREMQSLGLNQDSKVVVYDSLGLFSSARVWWMLRAMGCHDCAVLDGGLPAWIKAGYPLQAQEQSPEFASGDFSADFDETFFVDASTVLSSLNNPSLGVLDARSQARFSGEAKEPRAGLRKGHMPGAMNLPFAELFDQGMMKSPQDLKQILEPMLVDRNRTICSCGSGVTACILALAAIHAGYDNLAVYDGSWSEWGMPGDLPVVSD